MEVSPRRKSTIKSVWGWRIFSFAQPHQINERQVLGSGTASCTAEMGAELPGSSWPKKGDRPLSRGEREKLQPFRLGPTIRTVDPMVPVKNIIGADRRLEAGG